MYKFPVSLSIKWRLWAVGQNKQEIWRCPRGLCEVMNGIFFYHSPTFHRPNARSINQGDNPQIRIEPFPYYIKPNNILRCCRDPLQLLRAHGCAHTEQTCSSSALPPQHPRALKVWLPSLKATCSRLDQLLACLLSLKTMFRTRSVRLNAWLHCINTWTPSTTSTNIK